jgi:hypothetical protein
LGGMSLFFVVTMKRKGKRERGHVVLLPRSRLGLRGLFFVHGKEVSETTIGKRLT